MADVSAVKHLEDRRHPAAEQELQDLKPSPGSTRPPKPMSWPLGHRLLVGEVAPIPVRSGQRRCVPGSPCRRFSKACSFFVRVCSTSRSLPPTARHRPGTTMCASSVKRSMAHRLPASTSTLTAGPPANGGAWMDECLGWARNPMALWCCRWPTWSATRPHLWATAQPDELEEVETLFMNSAIGSNACSPLRNRKPPASATWWDRGTPQPVHGELVSCPHLDGHGAPLADR